MGSVPIIYGTNGFTFPLLMLGVHVLYRVKTMTWTQSWLDFVVIEDETGAKPSKIGKYYYTSILVIAVIAMLVSQVLG